ncbi:MAG: disulfide bond formation protein B [Pseudomonadota bacterium]
MSEALVARWLAFALPAGLLAGAYISQYVFGLFPCEMCWWQRYPHFVALLFAALAFFAPPARMWAALAGVGLMTSGVIGAFHAGVEYGWWQGITACAKIDGSINVLDPSAAPLQRCDTAPWDLFGISLAGFNFLFSSMGAIAIWALLALPQAKPILARG